jgi:hypothetical protein
MDAGRQDMMPPYPAVFLPVLVADSGFGWEYLPNIQLERLESTPYCSAAGALSPRALFSH